jgi:hypothetical protein
LYPQERREPRREMKKEEEVPATTEAMSWMGRREGEQ